MLKVAFFSSGTSTLLEKVIEKPKGYEIVVVFSNKPHAKVLEFARSKGLKTEVLSSKELSWISRDGFDNLTLERVVRYKPDVLVLAKYDRIVSTELIQRFPLGAFSVHDHEEPIKAKGWHALKESLNSGRERVAGSIHRVIENVDEGEVLARTRFIDVKGKTLQEARHELEEEEGTTLAEFLSSLKK